jgi:hypothetical protein
MTRSANFSDWRPSPISRGRIGACCTSFESRGSRKPERQSLNYASSKE